MKPEEVGEFYDLVSEEIVPPIYITAAVNEGLRAEDVRFRDLVDSWAVSLELDSELNFKDKSPDDPWRKPFLAPREKFPVDVVEPITDDDIPF